jgi:hypothetical protein
MLHSRRARAARERYSLVKANEGRLSALRMLDGLVHSEWAV